MLRKIDYKNPLKFIFILLSLAQIVYAGTNCSDTGTTAREPLKFIGSVCLEDNTSHSNFKNIYFENKRIYIAKGMAGFDVVTIEHKDYPVANSIAIKSLEIKDTHLQPADFIIADNEYAYLASAKQLIVYIQTQLIFRDKATANKSIATDMNVSYMHQDSQYVYIGGANQMKIYAKSSQSIVYDYNDIDGNILAITSRDNRIYISTDNNKIEVLAKNTINSNLILTKVKYDGYDISKNAKNLFINKKNNISFADNGTGGYEIISAHDMKTYKTYLPGNKGKTNSFINTDGFNIVSGDKGLFLEKETLEDIYSDSFNSAGIAIYDEFIMAIDKSFGANNIEELKLRVYKVNSVGASKVFGYVPLSTDFHIDTINIKEVEWVFGDSNSYPIKTRYPSYVYKKAGVFQALAKVTYESGRSYNNYVHIIGEDKGSFDFVLTNDKYSGAVPFDVKFNIDIDKSIPLKSIEWDFKDGSTSFNLHPVHTFKTVGTFNVTIAIENIDGIKVEKTVKIITKGVRTGEILATKDGSQFFANRNILLSLSAIPPTIDGKISPFLKYRWKIENRVFDTKELNYKFSSSGKKHIELLVYDSNGAEYLFQKDIEVFDYQTPLITNSISSGEVPLTVNFAIQVPSGVIYELNHIKWTLPNNKVLLDQSGSYVFNNEGLFKIRYEYRLSNGYLKKHYIDVNVSNQSNLAVTSSKTFGISPLSVIFDYKATPPSGIKEYRLDFGDGTKLITTKDTNYRHTFTKAQDYLATISSISNIGHKTSAEVLISVMDLNASYNTDNIDFNQLYANSIMPVNFQVGFKNAQYLSTYKWDFGDGKMSDAQTPFVSHTYYENRTYVAKLNLEFSDKSTTQKVFFISHPQPAGNLQVYKGWNLIGNTSRTPIKKSINETSLLPNQKYLDLSLYSQAHSIWIFRDGIWYKDPEYIDPEYGIWIDMKKDTKLPFYGERNIPILKDLQKGWHLVAIGISIPNLASYKFNKYMKYDNQNKKWINKPESVKTGEGLLFFIK